MTVKPLHILNASAGSGKTYSLVKKYIRLLLTADDSTRKYAEIIAMTFTNKAALEMKTRIISALDQLSNPEQDNHKYINQIAGDFNLPAAEIQLKSKRILSQLIHNYEDYNVLTIDKFNLRLIRSFSKELDIPADFEVVMNETELLQQVIDEMLSSIGKNQEVSDLVLNYVQNQQEDEEKWDFRKNLLEFTQVLSKEGDFQHVETLMKTDFSKGVLDELKLKKKSLDEQFTEISKAIYANFLSHSLASDELPGGGNTYRPICRTETYTEVQEQPFTDSFIKNLGAALKNGKRYPDDLKEHIWKLIHWLEKNQEPYFGLKKYISNFYNMALLKHVSNALEELKKRDRIIRISDFNAKISELLSGENPLYIYEKLGTRFKNFMLDEFQDTSRLQFLNLIPLIEETIANNSDALIVGDPKQAIYRFKNGVAEQMVELPKIYNPEQNEEIERISEQFNALSFKENLDDNWRSSETIVHFNNIIFETLRPNLSEANRGFYSSIKQFPKSTKNGLVSVHSKPVKKQMQAIELMSEILQNIEDCRTAGFKLGEICILGRTNGDCSTWANELTKHNFRVVSADSLRVENSPRVKTVLNYLKLRLNPSNQNIVKQFAYQYCIVKNQSISVFRSFFEKYETADGKVREFFNFDRFVETMIVSENPFLFGYQSLYDLIQQSYLLFGFEEANDPYIHHFADIIHNFELKNGSDLARFIADFDTMSKESKSVLIPESDDAIKIMTIHKSKGLEFPVVIIPSLSGDLSKVKGKHFIPTNEFLLYSGSSKESPIGEIVQFTEAEKDRIFLDYLNQIYVAFTRPIERLYITNFHTKSSIGNTFHGLFETLENVERNGDSLKYLSGSSTRSATTKRELEDNYFAPKQLNDALWFPNIALQDKKELISDQFLSEERRYGNQFHLIISRINSPDEIEDALNDMLQLGEIEHEFVETLRSDLKQLFGSKEYQALFENATEILSEQGFIVGPNEILRPDKIILKKEKTIVVDYKTGNQEPKHLKQISTYRNVLREMNYPHVEAFLFYTNTSELIQLQVS